MFIISLSFSLSLTFIFLILSIGLVKLLEKIEHLNKSHEVFTYLLFVDEGGVQIHLFLTADLVTHGVQVDRLLFVFEVDPDLVDVLLHAA